ncbi:MAG TPA: hypothetical protein DDY34_15120 [Bacteroidales bacterium]|nr:hypothetical protein [Bacteroidales bacterium]HBQ84235.1 hypothetical protein [Bacteroidales bacterium]
MQGKEYLPCWIRTHSIPYVAASRGYVDAVIEPSETRRFLLHAIEVSVDKDVPMPSKKHGLPPF